MGLDYLDITHRIEKEFRVQISHEELLSCSLENDVVIGNLFILILSKLQFHDAARYDWALNLDLWREMQYTLHTVTKRPLNRIELQTSMEELFPKHTRQSSWETLQQVCRYKIASLDYPRNVRVTCFVLTAVVVLIEQVNLWQMAWLRWFWPVLGMLAIWMLIETYSKILPFLAPFRLQFPQRMKTVKDLCKIVLARNYQVICRSLEFTVDERALEVWEQFTKILCDVLGVDPEDVTFQSRLVRDLGAN